MDAESNGRVNVRSDGYWIAHTIGACAHCRAASRLVALALPPGHQSLMFEGDDRRGEFVQYVWERARASAFLFYVEYLPRRVQRRLRKFSRGYRFTRSDPVQGCYWANHCVACGAPMDDHDLFCEPGGAFLPTSPASAAAITLVRIPQPLDAGAIGYACEPQFLESMVVG